MVQWPAPSWLAVFTSVFRLSSPPVSLGFSAFFSLSSLRSPWVARSKMLSDGRLKPKALRWAATASFLRTMMISPDFTCPFSAAVAAS